MRRAVLGVEEQLAPALIGVPELAGQIALQPVAGRAHAPAGGASIRSTPRRSTVARTQPPALGVEPLRGLRPCARASSWSAGYRRAGPGPRPPRSRPSAGRPRPAPAPRSARRRRRSWCRAPTRRVPCQISWLRWLVAVQREEHEADLEADLDVDQQAIAFGPEREPVPAELGAVAIRPERDLRRRSPAGRAPCPAAPSRRCRRASIAAVRGATRAASWPSPHQTFAPAGSLIRRRAPGWITRGAAAASR